MDLKNGHESVNSSPIGRSAGARDEHEQTIAALRRQIEALNEQLRTQAGQLREYRDERDAARNELAAERTVWSLMEATIADIRTVYSSETSVWKIVWETLEPELDRTDEPGLQVVADLVTTASDVENLLRQQRESLRQRKEAWPAFISELHGKLVDSGVSLSPDDLQRLLAPFENPDTFWGYNVLETIYSALEMQVYQTRCRVVLFAQARQKDPALLADTIMHQCRQGEVLDLRTLAELQPWILKHVNGAPRRLYTLRMAITLAHEYHSYRRLPDQQAFADFKAISLRQFQRFNAVYLAIRDLAHTTRPGSP